MSLHTPPGMHDRSGCARVALVWLSDAEEAEYVPHPGSGFGPTALNGPSPWEGMAQPGAQDRAVAKVYQARADCVYSATVTYTISAT